MKHNLMLLPLLMYVCSDASYGMDTRATRTVTYYTVTAEEYKKFTEQDAMVQKYEAEYKEAQRAREECEAKLKILQSASVGDQNEINKLREELRQASQKENSSKNIYYMCYSVYAATHEAIFDHKNKKTYEVRNQEHLN